MMEKQTEKEMETGLISVLYRICVVGNKGILESRQPRS